MIINRYQIVFGRPCFYH